MPTREQSRMAQVIGLHPDMPETWPIDAINNLIIIEATRPRIDFDLELKKISDYFARRQIA